MSPTHREEPPYEMKGRVMPVIGMRLATTAMFTHAWNASHTVMPVARIAPVASCARSAIRTPRNARTKNSRITVAVPMSPSSSPSTAKIESVYGAGRKPNFSFPAPSPSPNGPPRAKPYSIWIVWNPVPRGLDQGSTKARSRS